MTLPERLRAMADALPPSGSVTLTRSALLELIAEADTSPRTSKPNDAVDLKVAQVAEMFGRGASTVRTWLGEGRFPHAYQLRGREWRVPRADIEAMQRAEAESFKTRARQSRDR